MTDLELLTIAADKVMGWTLGADYIVMGDTVHRFMSALKGREWLQWRPLDYEHDAFDLVAAVCEKRGFWFKLHSPFQAGLPWWAGFCPQGTTGWNGEMDYAASSPERCRAITLSCLEAVGVQVWERGEK